MLPSICIEERIDRDTDRRQDRMYEWDGCLAPHGNDGDASGLKRAETSFIANAVKN